MNYPFESLPENLASFCSLLRRDYQFRIGPRELIDAARGLEITDLGNERAVRDALRIILSKTFDDVLRFDAAFDRFFRGADLMRRPDWIDGMDGVAGGPADTETGASETKPSSRGVSVGEVPVTAGVSSVVRELDQSQEEASASWLRASYSPLEGEGTPLVLEPPTQPWIDAARALVRRVHTAASRRWQPAPRGPRFDFRRTLRTSLRTAGEPVVPRWRAHPRRRARFVLLIDGSRSMGPSAGPPLELAVALSAVSPSTETFAFSTELGRITRDVRRAATGRTVTLDLRHAWGGGTTIGRCLEDFLQRFGERLLGLGTVVVIASDGLDVGDTDTLRQAMERLARRSTAVIWINPLLQTPGYQPTAIGMSMVRPHVAVLTSVADAAGVRALAGSVRIS
jgi:uncharacterized protein with von Willebrand factor type A (vWA) domain